MSTRLVPAAVTPISLWEWTQAVQRSLSGDDHLATFRRSVSAYFDKRHTYTFTSFMRATYACLVSLKQEHPSRRVVVLPRYSCPSFAHAILAAGLTIRYVDVRPTTLKVDMRTLTGALKDDTLAVIVSNLFGLSNPIDRIMAVAHKKGVAVLEGADYALGSVYKNKRVGARGDYTILNFQEGKALPIGGGAVVTSELTMHAWEDTIRPSSSLIPSLRMLAYSFFSRPLYYGLLIRLLTLLGIKRKSLSMEDTIRGTNSETDFVMKQGAKVRAISSFQAVLGCHILERLPADQHTREVWESKLAQGLRALGVVDLISPDKELSAIHWIRMPILVSRGRGKLIQSLAAAGIEASPMYIEHGMHINRREYPGAAQVAEELLTLPCHPYTTDEDVRTIITTIGDSHVSRV